MNFRKSAVTLAAVSVLGNHAFATDFEAAAPSAAADAKHAFACSVKVVQGSFSKDKIIEKENEITGEHDIGIKDDDGAMKFGTTGVRIAVDAGIRR